jgi:hypothetical protein
MTGTLEETQLYTLRSLDYPTGPLASGEGLLMHKETRTTDQPAGLSGRILRGIGQETE